MIAQRVTAALVDHFDCALARIWLTNPDQRSLTLVASAGLYTHVNGSFAQVAMGAYKVGKIAQNRMPFLSNCLPDEAWVKDRDWAITNRIQGFAGYPLMSGDRVLGVLATFSHQAMAPEFLEVLQLLCLTVTIALDAAMQFQQRQTLAGLPTQVPLALSDQVAAVMTSTRLMLVGTERPISPTIAYVLLRSAEFLNQLNCRYCRLTYGVEQIACEALVVRPNADQAPDTLSPLQEIQRLTNWLGGTLQAQPGNQNRVLEVLLQIPYQVPLAAVSLAEVQTGLIPSANNDAAQDPMSQLSEREQAVMALLSQGMRDRDISQQLHISESTVKFHINNTLTKLNAKNRYQAIHEATKRDWI